MPGVIILIVICICFYLFIGLGPKEAIKIMLALVWAIMILSIPLSLLYEVMR